MVIHVHWYLDNSRNYLISFPILMTSRILHKKVYHYSKVFLYHVHLKILTIAFMSYKLVINSMCRQNIYLYFSSLSSLTDYWRMTSLNAGYDFLALILVFWKRPLLIICICFTSSMFQQQGSSQTVVFEDWAGL